MELLKRQNLFADRSSLIFRAMLREPERKWVIADFVQEGVSAGLSNKILTGAEERGYVQRRRAGWDSWTRLVQKELLLNDWSQAYGFEDNLRAYLNDPSGEFLGRFDRWMKRRGRRYALTGFGASRLIAPFKATAEQALYVDADAGELRNLVRELQDFAGLQELAAGGNVCLAVPFYKNSVFRDAREIRGYPAVSNLQLYLDLKGLPRGEEEIGNLASYFRSKGKAFV